MEKKNNPSEGTQDEFQEGVQAGDGLSDRLIFKRSHLYSVLLPLAFVAGLAVGYIFWGRGESRLSQMIVVPDGTAAAEQPGEVRRYEIPEDDDPVYGPENAPITIIEFSDYECSYCRKWHVEVWPHLLEAYPDQIRLVYRDFPLTNIHSNATPAASAANCAREQDRYWEFNERLFSMVYDLSVSGYQAYAEELEMDMAAFNECLDSGRHAAAVQSDLQEGAGFGVTGTPAFFINGYPVQGAQPYESFERVIETLLSEE